MNKKVIIDKVIELPTGKEVAKKLSKVATGLSVTTVGPVLGAYYGGRGELTGLVEQLKKDNKHYTEEGRQARIAKIKYLKEYTSVLKNFEIYQKQKEKQLGIANGKLEQYKQVIRKYEGMQANSGAPIKELKEIDK